MKRTQIVATLAFAFVLGASIPIKAFATEQGSQTGISTLATTETASEVTKEVVVTSSDVNNLATIFNDVNISKITLGEDISFPKNLKINRPSSSPLVVDLGGHTLRYTQSGSNKYAIILQQGNISFVGAGRIVGSNVFYVLGAEDPSAHDYTVLNIGEHVTVEGTEVYSVAISDNVNYSGANYGTRVRLDGTFVAPYGISVDGYVHNTYNAPIITVGDTASITSPADTPIYAAGYANWTFGSAQIGGQLAVGIKSGHFTFNGTTIDIDGSDIHTPGTQTSGIDANSSVFQIEHNSKYAGDIQITINGGSYSSTSGNVFYEYGLADGEVGASISITSGAFQGTDVANFEELGYIADGSYLLDGTVYRRHSHKSSSSSTTDTVLTSDDVTVSGTLPAGVSLTVEPSTRDVALFRNLPHQIYDITLLDRYGDKFIIDGKVTVAIRVPSNIDCSRAHVYYLADDGQIERLDSTYADGIITFETTHFSLYAIVEDLDESGVSAIAPIDGGDVAPDTGLNQKRGALTAAATIIPMLIGARGIIFMVTSQRVLARRKAAQAAEAELEMAEQLSEIIEDEPEPVIERFAAEAIKRDDPAVTPVDTFILQK